MSLGVEGHFLNEILEPKYFQKLLHILQVHHVLVDRDEDVVGAMLYFDAFQCLKFIKWTDDTNLAYEFTYKNLAEVTLWMIKLRYRTMSLWISAPKSSDSSIKYKPGCILTGMRYSLSGANGCTASRFPVRS